MGRGWVPAGSWRCWPAQGIPATFFMPAVSALLHPEEMRCYVTQGHEVGMHGWIHERTGTLRPEDERELALRSADVLEKGAGTRPVGIRTPSWDSARHAGHHHGTRPGVRLVADGRRRAV